MSLTRTIYALESVNDLLRGDEREETDPRKLDGIKAQQGAISRAIEIVRLWRDMKPSLRAIMRRADDIESTVTSDLDVAIEHQKAQGLRVRDVFIRMSTLETETAARSLARLRWLNDHFPKEEEK